MTTLQHINYLAVAVAALSYFILGALWYSPVLFVKAWMDGNKITMPTSDEEKKQMRKGMGRMFAITFICCFGASLGLACIENLTGLHNITIGLKAGVLAAVFASIALAMNHQYTMKPLKLFIIDAAYHTCGLIIAAVILSVWA